MAKKTVKRTSKAVADLSETPVLSEDSETPNLGDDTVDTPADNTADSVAPDGDSVDAALTGDDTVVVAADDMADIAAPVTQSTEPQRTRAWPLFLGGIAAAIFGFLAARADLIDSFLPPSMRAGAEQSMLAENLKEANSQIARLKGDLQNLNTKLENQPLPDTSGIGELQAALTAQNDRIAKLEKRPVGTGSGSNYDAEFAELQAIAAAQQAEIDKLLTDARLVEKSTEDAANSTLARAAATRIIAAIESGAPFDAALNDLESTGVTDIPATLKDAAANGVTPLATLQADIPDAARAALAASPSTDGGFGGFLKRSLGARSTEPREGSDTDAILSRIEAAARNGRLTDAIAEAETLPPEGQAAMAEWLDRARTRQSVMSASETLMQRLAAN